MTTLHLPADDMSAFELRRHLHTQHQQPSRGLSWDQLVAVHERAHQTAATHVHEGET